MSMTKTRHAVAYHFQNDFDTGPVVEKYIRMTYDGPLDLAQDFMVWNVSKDGIRTRMAVPNEERFPEPAQRPAVPQKGAEGYKWDPINFEGVERETSAVINERLREFNEKYGTNVEPTMTGIPFKDDK